MVSTLNSSISTPFTTQTPGTTALTPAKKLSNSDIALIIIYVNIFLFGLVGNCLVIRYFGFQRKKILLYHTYLIHLAIADLISSTITPFHFIYGVVSFNVWHLGAVPCKVISLIGPLTVNVSAWLLTSIAHERYRGIVNPFKPRWTKLRIHLTVAMIWIVSAITLIPYLKAMQLYEGIYCMPQWSSPVYELISALLTLLLQSMLPITFMIYSVSKILYVLRNRMHLLASPNVKKRINVDASILVSSERTYSSSSNTSSHGNVNKQNNTTAAILSPAHRFLSISSFSVLWQQTNKRKIPNFNRLKESPSPKGRKRIQNGYELLLRKNKFPRKIQRRSPHILRITESPVYSSNEESPMKKRSSQVSFNVSPRRNISSSLSNHESSNCFSKKSLSLDTGLNFIRSRRTEKCIMAGFRKKASAPVSRRKSVYKTMKKFMTIENKRAKKRGKTQRERIFMLIVTFSVFVICSLPYNIFYVTIIVIIEFFNDYSKLKLLSDLNFWLSTLVVANSITNCAIYAGMDKGFRAYCFGLLKKAKWNNFISSPNSKKKLQRKFLNREIDSSFTN